MTALRRQAVRFAAVGVANTAAGLLVIWSAMYFFGVRPAAANAMGYAVGLSLGFALNRRWSFGGSVPTSAALPKYFVMVAIAYLFNLMMVLWATAGSLNAYFAQLSGMAVYTLILFAGCRLFVFAPAASRVERSG